MINSKYNLNYLIIFFLFFLVGTISFFKGWLPEVQIYGTYIWELNYKLGFVRRGLIGTLLSDFFFESSRTESLSYVYGIYAMMYGVFITSCSRLSVKTMEVVAPPFKLVCCLLSLLFFASPVFPTLGYMVGFPDILLFQLGLLGCLGLWMNSRFIPLIVSVIGILIHEGFVYIWCPLLIFWGIIEIKNTVKVRFILIALIISSMLGIWVRYQPFPDKAELLLNKLTADIASVILNPSNDTFTNAIRRMIGSISANWSRFIISLIWSQTFNIVMTMGVYFILRSLIYLKKRILISCLIFGCSLLTTTILMVAWDFARFLIWSQFVCYLCCMFAIIKFCSSPPDSSREIVF